ncbi:MAG: DUF4846 domain-containing protein [Hyphomicrobiales bacterium]|nr:DUF4846 domain-containing protein [Hyphomicrobiales bacterium]
MSVHYCLISVFAIAVFLIPPISPAGAAPEYTWPSAAENISGGLKRRIAAPRGYERIPVEAGSFAEWLRNLPVRPDATPIRLYDGRLRATQDRHAAVIAIDTGNRDLQQCADAVMRLRAEYLLSIGQTRKIAFNYTNGQRVRYRGKPGDRKAFRRYMTGVFAYAGTYSLEKQLRKVDLKDIQIGDIFIKGGFPGHAMIVADIARDRLTGSKRFLLIQSFMPAQDMHVVKAPGSRTGSPWYDMPEPDGELLTPDWIFPANTLHRFAD